jgi:hypothetical protein
LQRRASSMAPRMAWVHSGAATMPSARANITPAAKQSVWCTLRASIRPSSMAWLTSGAMPW